MLVSEFRAEAVEDLSKDRFGLMAAVTVAKVPAEFSCAFQGEWVCRPICLVVPVYREPQLVLLPLGNLDLSVVS